MAPRLGKARYRSLLLESALMHPIVHELVPIRALHVHFANWERAKHRADFFAKIGFPDSHPLRHTIEQVCRGLDPPRRAADQTISEIARKYGDFCIYVNGQCFEGATDWFQSGKEIYRDCPEIAFGKGVRRCNKLYLAGVSSIHDLETSGRAFIAAVLENLAESVPSRAKRDLVRTARTFDKDCQRLERQLKRVKVCPRDCLDVLLCLRRKGVPSAVGRQVLGFLV